MINGIIAGITLLIIISAYSTMMYLVNSKILRMETKYQRLRKWKLPFTNKYVVATIQKDMLYLHIEESNESGGYKIELGFWTNGEWMLREREAHTPEQVKREMNRKRLTMIIFKRYAARITRLQNILSIQTK